MEKIDPIIQIAVALVKEVGQDLEHCQTLMKKFNDFEKASYFLSMYNVCTQLLVHHSVGHTIPYLLVVYSICKSYHN